MGSSSRVVSKPAGCLDVSGAVSVGQFPGIPCLSAGRHDLLRCTVTTILSRLRDRISCHLAPLPSAGDGRPPAGAVKYISFRKAGNRGDHTRPVAIGTEGHQVPGEALRTFHAMANTVA